MKIKREASWTMIGSMLILGSAISTSFAGVSESDYFTDTIGSVDQTVNLVTDYGANGTDSNNDSAALQSAINDMTALSNGGQINIPAGTFYFIAVELKSNVHIKINKNAKLKLVAKESSGSMFKIGSGSTTARNVSVRASGGKYTVDFKNSTLNSKNKAVLFNISNANNFMVAGFKILDKQSKMPSVHVVGSDTIPQNGIVKNGIIVDAHYGYGLVQTAAGSNILYKNLKGTGGTTLRFEGSDAYNIPLSKSLNNIVGETIKIINGHNGVTIACKNSPHGRVDINGVTAISSLHALTMGCRTTAARYDQNSTIKNVKSTYGTLAEFAPKNFTEIPRVIRDQITDNPVYGNIYRGPSAVCLRLDNSALPLGNIQNVTHSGFQYISNPIYVSDGSNQFKND